MSRKALKAVLVSLADGALEWRLRPGAEVAADLASPHGDAATREADEFFVVFRWSSRFRLSRIADGCAMESCGGRWQCFFAVA